MANTQNPQPPAPLPTSIPQLAAPPVRSPPPPQKLCIQPSPGESITSALTNNTYTIPAYRPVSSPESRRSTSDRRSEISLFPDSAGNKGRSAQPPVRFPIFGINDNMLVVVWGLGVLRRDSGGTTEVSARGAGRGGRGQPWRHDYRNPIRLREEPPGRCSATDQSA
jgi:hypothetical protein